MSRVLHLQWSILRHGFNIRSFKQLKPERQYNFLIMPSLGRTFDFLFEQILKSSLENGLWFLRCKVVLRNSSLKAFYRHLALMQFSVTRTSSTKNCGVSLAILRHKKSIKRNRRITRYSLYITDPTLLLLINDYN